MGSRLCTKDFYLRCLPASVANPTGLFFRAVLNNGPFAKRGLFYEQKNVLHHFLRAFCRCRRRAQPSFFRNAESGHFRKNKPRVRLLLFGGDYARSVSRRRNGGFGGLFAGNNFSRRTVDAVNNVKQRRYGDVGGVAVQKNQQRQNQRQTHYDSDMLLCLLYVGVDGGGGKSAVQYGYASVLSDNHDARKRGIAVVPCQRRA